MLSNRILNIIYLSIIIAIFTVIIFGYFRGTIIFFNPDLTVSNNFIGKTIETKIFFLKNREIKEESTKIIFYDDNINLNMVNIINKWFEINNTENNILEKSTVESVAFDKHEQTAYLNFEKRFLPKSKSTYTKLLIIKSLIKTISSTFSKINYIKFMILDDHLDFSFAWPTK